MMTMMHEYSPIDTVYPTNPNVTMLDPSHHHKSQHTQKLVAFHQLIRHPRAGEYLPNISTDHTIAEGLEEGGTTMIASPFHRSIVQGDNITLVPQFAIAKNTPPLPPWAFYSPPTTQI